MPSSPAIVIGAGLAGLSAAVECAASGKRVLVLEQHQYAGGRTRSFRDETTGDVVDNGQHLLMGCYSATRRYLNLIGSEHLAFLQPTLRIPYLRAVFASSVFQASTLPAPLHVLGGLLRFRSIPWSERVMFRRIATALMFTSTTKEAELDSLTAEQWLASLGQGPEARRYLWDVITIGALNEHPQNVSALLLYRVLRAAFFGARENASLMIPQVGLSELLVDPALRFIQQRGGSIRFNAEVTEIVESNGSATGVRTSAGEFLPAASVIVAVPWHAIDVLVKSSRLFPESPFINHKSPIPNPQSPITTHQSPITSSFSPSAIICLHLWFNRRLMAEPLAAVLDKRIQWIFAKESIIPNAQRLSLVISGADALADIPKEQLVADALHDLEQLLPDIETAKLIHSLVIKEKRATFVPRPGLESVRRALNTPISNLYVAGDWTDTGYPATIEGAVVSGVSAVRNMERGFRK